MCLLVCVLVWCSWRYSLCLLLRGVVAGVLYWNTGWACCVFSLLFSLVIARVFVWVNSVGICDFVFCIVDCCADCLVVCILWILIVLDLLCGL